MTRHLAFGTDGIRGIAGEWPIDREGAAQIGLGLGLALKETSDAPAVVIGRDTRESGAMLADAVAEGLMAAGATVTDVGVIPTAGVAYLSRLHGQAAGVVISASHNPWQENGIKVLGGDGFKLGETAERAIEAQIARVIAGDIPHPGIGERRTREDWAEEYISFLTKPFRCDYSALRIGIDCANGAASGFAERCFKALGASPLIINSAPDGQNINRDAGSERVRSGHSDLREMVIREGLDFGVAFDGDADRAIFVDEKGAMLDGDHVLYIFASHLKRGGKLAGDAIVTTVMANSGLERALATEGITTIKTTVGDKYIVAEMRERGLIVGGEQSGHILVFKDPDQTTGDGLYTALYMAAVLIRNAPVTISELAQPLVKMPQVVASARVAAKPPLEEIAALAEQKARLLETLGESATINTRYSGTENVFRVMIEGGPAHTLAQIAREAVALCRIVQAEAGSPDGPIEVKDTTTGTKIDASGHAHH